MKEATIRVETYFEEDLPEVMASTNQMRQVLLNLFKNAKEAMPKGGTLTVRTERQENNVFIHIQDTGVGIPEEIRNKIFEAFFTTKQKVKGVGLGLSVCYGIIKGPWRRDQSRKRRRQRIDLYHQLTNINLLDIAI